jgi:diaminopimelate epimerase
MQFNFSKMHGLGNDFVVIDALNQKIDLTSAQIRQISDRHCGIGFDQLLLVEKPVSDNADFKYRIYNADGGEVAQCGNGARCFAKFVREKHLTHKKEIVVDTLAGQLVLSFTESNSVTVNMGVPRHSPAEVPMMISQEAKLYNLYWNENEVVFYAVSMGNPHIIIQVEDIESAPVSMLGEFLQNHPLFPEKVNVGFMQITNRQHIRLRVYERGAAETLACGSGACAAVVAGIEQRLLDQNVSVSLPRGELLIEWLGRGQPVQMTGPATWVYDGRIDI